MKKFILSLSIVACCFSVVFAQQTDRVENVSTAEQAENLVNQLAKSLELTPDQIKSIRPMIESTSKQIMRLKAANPKMDEMQMRKQEAVLISKQEHGIKSELSEDQLKRYEVLRVEMMEQDRAQNDRYNTDEIKTKEAEKKAAQKK